MIKKYGKTRPLIQAKQTKIKKRTGTETLHLNKYNCNFAYKNNICEGMILKYKIKKLKIQNIKLKIKNKKKKGQKHNERYRKQRSDKTNELQTHRKQLFNHHNLRFLRFKVRFFFFLWEFCNYYCQLYFYHFDGSSICLIN